MPITYIDALELKNKRVFIRADLNVPLKQGTVADDTRIRASLDTIQIALKQQARVIVASHLGRPDGEIDLAYSLRPVATRLAELLQVPVSFAPDCIGNEVEALVENLAPGSVLLLENLRFHAGETKNDPAFSSALGRLADVYVNDAFATAHRAHASTAGITKFVKTIAGGLTLKRELDYFSKALENPKRPLVVIFGGAKVSTKMAAIKNVVTKADTVIIGGAMANTFFAAHGYTVGSSLFEPTLVSAVAEIEAQAKASGCAIVLPVDVVVAPELQAGIKTRTVAITEIGAVDRALDIGPKSIDLIKRAIVGAHTIVWNGPMGAFETAEFSQGTYALVELISQSPALTVVGGGDTDRALHDCHAFEKMDYVSTAGGAFLELLEGKVLPAVAALSEQQ